MSTPGAAVQTSGLGKRYGRTWALQDCSFRLPQGRIAALVGPNGAGKSTLLRMLAGISTPTAGELSVLGRSPGTQTAEMLARIGYLDQDRPLYKGLRVSEMLRFGRELNPRWDDASARRHLDELAIPFGVQDRPASPAASRLRSRSRCAWPSGPNCCCSTSRWPRSTRWPATT